MFSNLAWPKVVTLSAPTLLIDVYRLDVKNLPKQNVQENKVV